MYYNTASRTPPITLKVYFSVNPPAFILALSLLSLALFNKYNKAPITLIFFSPNDVLSIERDHVH